jgi:hypothetical protein
MKYSFFVLSFLFSLNSFGDQLLYRCTSVDHTNIYDIVKENDGYIWLKTQAGYLNSNCNGEFLTISNTANGLRFDNQCTKQAPLGHPVVQLMTGGSGTVFHWLYGNEDGAIKKIDPVTCVQN